MKLSKLGLLPNKKCIICAQEKPLNDFYPNPRSHDVYINLEWYISNWLSDFLKIKAQVLQGSLKLEDNTLDEISKKDLTRDIKIITDIIKKMEKRSVSYDSLEIEIFEHLNRQELQLIEQNKRSPTFFLGIEQVDQLVKILVNEEHHIESHDDTYDSKDNEKTLKMIHYILYLMEEQVLNSRYDVCINCLKLHHPSKDVHPSLYPWVKDKSYPYCEVCSRWTELSEKERGDFPSAPKEFPEMTDFRFSYEIPRLSPRRGHDDH